MFNSSNTETYISRTSELSEKEYKTMLNQSIREFNKEFGPKSEARKKKEKRNADKKKNKTSYDNLLLQIKRDEKTVKKLEKENQILKAQIKTCEDKIKAYPKVKKQYDKLSISLERAQKAESSPKKH